MTTATETNETETTESTKVDYSVFGPYAATFQNMIPALQTVAENHDDLVSQLSIKEGEVNEEALEIARIRNKSSNTDVTKLNEAIRKLQDKLDETKAKAYELVQDDVPQPLTEDEKAAVKPRIKDLRDEFKKMTDAIETIAAATGMTDTLAKVSLPSITTNGRRTGSGTGKTGHSGPRIHMDEVYVNGELIQVEKPNKPGEFASTLTGAANYISATVKANPRVSASDLQVSYFAAANVTPDSDGKVDVSSIPASVDFTYVYTNPSDQAKTEFAITAKRTM